jgi:PKD domain-containing protein
MATPGTGQAPVTVSVAANCSDSKASVKTMFVDFGDGYFQSGGSTAHTYVEGGTFAVSVHANDDAGNSAVGKASVSIKGPSSIFVGVNNGQVKEFAKDGSLVGTLNTNEGGSTTGMGFDLLGNLYVTNFTANSVSKFAGGGNVVGSFGSGYNCKPESIAFDNAGNAYVGETGCSHALLKFDVYGNLMASYEVATEVEGSDWIDLASDQCTMYYTSQGKSVLRYNVCNQQQLTPLATDLETGLAIKVLPDGGALVANRHNVVRLDSNGNIVTTYDAPGEDCWSGLTLDNDGSSFWATDYCTSDVFRFDIASGGQLLKFNTGTPPKTVFAVGTLTPATSTSAGAFFAAKGTASISKGQAASYTLSFEPASEAQGQTFTFSCADLPTGATCVFSPSSATAHGHMDTTLTIQTTLASAKVSPVLKRTLRTYVLMLPILGLIIVSLPRRGQTKKHMALCIMLLAIAHFAGCSGASTGNNNTNSGPTAVSPPSPSSGTTPSGTYTILVHATSQSFQSSTAIQLSVQ